MQEHAQAMLERTGLAPIALQLQTWENEEATSRGPLGSALPVAALTSAMQRLDAFLSAASLGLAEPCEKLTSTRFRQMLSDRAARYVLILGLFFFVCVCVYLFVYLFFVCYFACC